MTGRATVWLVARRELTERLRDRSFRVSTTVTLLILAAVVVLPRLLGAGEPATYDLGLVGPASGPVGTAAVGAARAAGVQVRTRPVASPAEAERLLRAEDLDVAVVDGRELVVKEELPPELGALLQQAVATVQAREALSGAGVSEERIQAALAPPPAPVRRLDPPDPRREGNRLLAFVTMMVLYGQLIGYGFWVAAGVVEEKASRVIELLLAATRPAYLLAGKIIGIGLLGLGQLLLIAAVGLGLAVGLDVIALPRATAGTVGLTLLWFVLGYAFYSSLFAAAGAMVPRQEELQNSSMPMTLLIVASLLVGITALQDPEGTLAAVATFLPPTAPLVVPALLATGDVAPWAVAASVAVTLATTAALVPLAGRIYAATVLRTGSAVKLREALAAARGR